MFSSTHFRSSSCENNTISYSIRRNKWPDKDLKPDNFSLKCPPSPTHHFVGFGRSVGLVLHAPHLHTFCTHQHNRDHFTYSTDESASGSWSFKCKERNRKRRGRFLTKSLVHHGLLLLFFFTLFVHQRAEGIPATETQTLGFDPQLKGEHWRRLPRRGLYLWLLADGRHRNMITNKMVENKKRQKASSIHSSLQSCRHRVKTRGKKAENEVKVHQSRFMCR